MKHPDYNSPSALKNFMDSRNLAMQKKFGQNFLVNPTSRINIVNHLDLHEKTTVWEIGPGLGAMTEEILSRGSVLTAFEIDRGFITLLEDFFSEERASGNFRIIEGDVLKTWKTAVEQQGIPDRFFGNLPYNIAASLVGDTIEHGTRFEKAVITVQKEVADRMTAKPGSEDYSSFSVICQWAYNISSFMELSAGNFWPRPNVTSKVVEMSKTVDFPRCENPGLFMRMQRALFSSRRKTVKNNLAKFLTDSDKAQRLLFEADVAPQLRAETLSLDTLLRLSDRINADIIDSKA